MKGMSELMPCARPDRIFLCLWIALLLLFLVGLVLAWLNGWRYRTFVYWPAYLLLFVGTSATLYLRVARYDDERERKSRHVVFAALSSVLGNALFLTMFGLLPAPEASSKDGYVEITWAGEGFWLRAIRRMKSQNPCSA